MADLIERAREWIAADPDPEMRRELKAVIESGDLADLESRMDSTLSFGTAGIRGRVGAGPGRMNRAVVIRTTYGLATYLGEPSRASVVVGFDARPTSRRFAEDTAGVLAAAGISVFYFPNVVPTPIVAYAAKHLSTSAAVVVTASHNPPADNGYKVYGPDASQIVSPVDELIQEGIDAAPAADDVDRVEGVFDGASSLVRPVPDHIIGCYWDEVSALRSRSEGSNLRVVYTPIHGVGRDTLFEIMGRAGHTGLVAVAEQAEPDGTFPTVAFPNPEEPGALDLALATARRVGADLVVANDPDADRLAVVVPHEGVWRALSGNEIGVLLGNYILANDPGPESAIVASSIVSSPMLGRVAAAYGARWEQTLTGFKWIVKAGRSLEEEGVGRFVFGYEEALGYTVGSIVRDKDGLSAALLFTDLVADARDRGGSVMADLHSLWTRHGLWVSSQTALMRDGAEGVRSIVSAVERLADNPPDVVAGRPVTGVVDYRKGATRRPAWLAEQALVELSLGGSGRILVRPSGTEPKLKIYVDLCSQVGPSPDEEHRLLLEMARDLGEAVGDSLGI